MSEQWEVQRVKAHEGSRREYVWEVRCPAPPDDPTWDNDFRPERCGCRRFPSEGKARRYVERMARPTENFTCPSECSFTHPGREHGQ